MKRESGIVINLSGMIVRHVHRTELTAVNSLLRQLHPGRSIQPDPQLTWVAVKDGRILACLSIIPVPGLVDVFNLAGGVHPDFQRQKIGSRLWTAVQPQLPILGVRRVSHAVTNLASPAAHFLRRHHFFIEHEEWLMRLPHLQTCQLANPSPIPNHLHIHLLTPAPVHLFMKLYDQSFGGTPWYQPYSQEEVENTLDDPDDILFLFKDGRAIGFAWLQGEAQEAAIEPIGIVPEEQRKGYGRFLLQFALHELKNRGAAQAKIGVWRENGTAVHLYQSLGFQHCQTLVYLAYDIW